MIYSMKIGWYNAPSFTSYTRTFLFLINLSSTLGKEGVHIDENVLQPFFFVSQLKIVFPYSSSESGCLREVEPVL